MKGCAIKVTVRFPNQYNEQDSSRKKSILGGSTMMKEKKLRSLLQENIKEQVKECTDNPRAYNELKEELAELMKKRRQRRHEGMNQDFL